MCLQPGLITRAHQDILEWTPDRVVLSLSQVLLGLISEHPVLQGDVNIHAYRGVEGVEEPQGYAIEEELVVSDSRRHVLFLEDLVVVDTELKVGGAIPSRVRGVGLTRGGVSRSTAWGSECPCRNLTYYLRYNY